MIRDAKRIWAAALTLVGTMLIAGGCAQDVGDIDRTQPNKVEKSIFQDNDEWYYTQTVVDTDSQGNLPLVGYDFGLKRVRWEVTEDTLYAYSTVEPEEGLNKNEQAEDKEKLGVVAAFPVKSHFDVQRSYNSQTGAPRNVIRENRSDRPWYKREFMRIAWESMPVTSQTVGQMLGRYRAHTRATPQKDRKIQPNRTRVGEDYIDVTVQYTFRPDPMSCFQNLGYDAVSYCDGGKVMVRHSFKRMKPEEKRDSYDPLVYNPTKKIYPNGDDTEDPIMTRQVYDDNTGYQMQVQCNRQTAEYLRRQNGMTTEGCQPATFEYNMRFGYFRHRRVEYNGSYPQTDPSRQYYAKRWDIWQDMDKKLKNKLGGESLNGNKAPKRIVYHTNAQYPKKMLEAADEIEKRWDRVMKKAVALGGGYTEDGRVTQEDIDQVTADLEKIYDDDHANRMFVIKQNSCLPGPLTEWASKHGGSKSADRRNVSEIFNERLQGTSGSNVKQKLWDLAVEERVKLCAELEWATAKRNETSRFTYERLGDLRYSFFNWARDFVPWLGLGPAAADPLTGKIVTADANFAGRHLPQLVAEGADKIEYMTGELSNSDIRYGSQVREYINSMKKRRQQRLQQGLEPGEMPAEAERELVRRTGSKPGNISPTNFEEAPDLSQQPDIVQRMGLEKLRRKFDRISMRAEKAKRADTRWAEFYENPKIKSALMKDPKFQVLVEAMAAEKHGPKNVDDEALHQAYMDAVTPHRSFRREKQSRRWMAERNMYAVENARRAIDGLVTLQGISDYFEDKSRDEIETFLRKHIFMSTQLHELGHTLGLRHNYNASMDAMNYHDAYWRIQKKVVEGEIDETDKYSITDSGLVQEVTNGERSSYANAAEYKNASIMEYMPGLTSDFAGIGKYDQAAINFAYADRVQVWDDDVNLSNRLDFNMTTGDYSELPRILGESAYGSNAGDKSSEEIRKRGIEVILNGRKWKDVDEVMANKRDRIRQNTRKWHDGEFGPSTAPTLDRTVSYNYCSDRREGLTLGCDTWDRGANHTEIVTFAFDTYRFMQPFWRYRGQKISNLYQNVRRYRGRVLSTLETAETPFRYYSYYRFLDLGGFTEDLKRASIKSLNFFAEIVAQPEPGRYCRYNDNSVGRDDNWYKSLGNSYVPADWHALEGQCPSQITVPRGTGQYYDYEYSKGWSPANEYSRIQRVGTYVDKMLASTKLFRISGNFINSSFVTDTRATKVSFWTLFRDEMTNWLGSVVMDDFTGFAGRWNSETDRYMPPKIVDPATLGVEESGETPNRDGTTTQSRSIQPVVRTRASFSQQLQTIAGALLSDSSWEDRAVDTRQYMKINVYQDEYPNYGEDANIKRFVHPVTKVVYTAPQTSDGKSVTVELVEWANELKADWKQAKKRLESDDLQEGTAAYQEVKDEVDIRLNQMEDVVAKMNMIRDVSNLIDLGR